MADGADALWRGNPLGVGAVVNCAEEDWLHQVRKGRVGAEAAVFTTELRDSFDKLEEAPEGGARFGTVMGVKYLSFSAKDVDPNYHRDEKIPAAGRSYIVADHFPASMAFVSDHLGRGEKVLIHCLRGENRSAAVCAAFLIRERGMPCEEAIGLIREKRGENALSNESFVDELRRLSPSSPKKPPNVGMTTPSLEETEWPPTPVKPGASSDGSPLLEECGNFSPGDDRVSNARRSTCCALL